MAAKKPPKALALPKRDGRKRGAAAWVLDEAGNRTCLTPQLAERAVSLMRERWLWPNRIAVMIGVSPDTMFGWVKRGVDEGIEPYASFADEMAQAEAESSAELFDVVRRAALGQVELQKGKLAPDVKVAVWLLERRFGEDWRGAGGSILGVVLQVEGEKAAEVRAKVDGWLRSLPPEVVANGRQIGLALDDPRPVDGNA